MVRDQNYFEVARSRFGVYIKVHGFGNLTNAPIFNAFADKMVDEDWTRFVVDLETCRGVDSTFMGMLLGVQAKARDRSGDDSDTGLLLVNVSDHCRKQLSSIGLDAFLSFRDVPTTLPRVELRRLEAPEVSPNERLSLILKAHQDLVAFDRRNASKFGPFLRSILRDL
jgi:anti-sigma B factor antagonist